MVTFRLLAIAALLPCFLCQSIAQDPLCKNKVCPTGQICRHFKPCGQTENCSIIAVCTATQATRGGCKFGDPVLYSNNGTEEDLTCYTKAPCPSNGYCSTLLQDISAVCCLSDPAKTERKTSTCPAFKPDPRPVWCVDECKSDGDCSDYHASKCCNTGCSMECVTPESAPSPPPMSLPPQPRPPTPPVIQLEPRLGKGLFLPGFGGGSFSHYNGDPCASMTCPVGQTCRHYKPCGQLENCLITAMCTSSATPATRGACMIGDPVLYSKNGRLEELPCHTDAPCPSNGYCSTVLQDIGAMCCLSDPAKRQRDDLGCPVPIADPNRFWCVDGCKVDGDCLPNSEKCCYTGCSKECVPAAIAPTLPPTLPPTVIINPTGPSRHNDPCYGKVCPIGQKCRHYKPCGLTENCGDVIGICTASTEGSYGCRHGGGGAVLYNNGGKQSMLVCYREAPCPGNAYCSTELADASSRCCLTAPARAVKPGSCPATYPYETNAIFCYDTCKHDGDCSWDSKCCNTGCKLECVAPEFTPTPKPTLSPSHDPCDNKVCPAGQTCRHYKPCGLMEDCGDVIATCTAIKSSRYGCMHGSPVLYNNRGYLDMLVCYQSVPCPGNAYCSTVLMDTSSRCCLTDPAKSIKPGLCPAKSPYSVDKRFCYDTCKHDGDCSWSSKCCHTGCRRECVKPTFVPQPQPNQPQRPTLPPVIPPKPSQLPINPPLRPRDPCDNKFCPNNMYCRKRGQPCRDPMMCGPEGNCLRCPRASYPNYTQTIRRRLITDADGCTAVAYNPFAPAPGPYRGPFSYFNPLKYLLLSELMNKK